MCDLRELTTSPTEESFPSMEVYHLKKGYVNVCRFESIARSYSQAPFAQEQALLNHAQNEGRFASWCYHLDLGACAYLVEELAKHIQ